MKYSIDNGLPIGENGEWLMRHNQFKREMWPYTQAIVRIYDYAPLPGFIFKPDGSCEQLPLDSKYQEQVDRVLNDRDKHIADRFPDLLKELNQLKNENSRS
jgi:hypothetical protein